LPLPVTGVTDEPPKLLLPDTPKEKDGAADVPVVDPNVGGVEEVDALNPNDVVEPN